MLVEQISIFIENRTGRLHDVCELLASNNINMAAVTVADTTDFGIMRALTNDIKKTVEILNNAGFANSVTNLIAVDVENQPGGLAKVLKVLDLEKIAISYLYSFAGKGENAIILLKVNETEKALELLKNHDICLVTEPLV